MASNKGQSSYVVYLWISFLVVGIVPGVVSNVQLTSIPSTDQPICPGETIEFTCIIESSILLWTSDEYIGVGSQFEFRSIDSIGIPQNSPTNADTIATLTEVNSGILTSTLRVVASQSSTIACINGDDRTSATFQVQIAAVPGAPRNVMAVGSMEDCMIQVTWDPPDTGGSDYTYRVDIPSRNITADNSSTESILHVPNCDDDNIILIQVYAVNRFDCMRSAETLLRLQSASTTTASSQLGAGAIAGIAISSIIPLLCSTLLLFLFYYYLFWRRERSSAMQDNIMIDILLADYATRATRHATSTSESHELATNIPKAKDMEYAWKFQRMALVQAKECYQQQSKYNIGDLGTEENRVSVPIWIDDELDDGWKASLREAVQAINEAAPGLSLSITEDKEQAIIHILATDEKEAYTEGNILMRFITGQSDYITKIHLGKWEDDAKDGISTRELFHALGFHQDNDLGLTRFDLFSITLYQSEEAYDSVRKKHPGDPVWRLKRNPTKKNTKLSGLDKVCLNLVYRPCKSTRGDSTRCKYIPKLGRNGMYYCGRRVMSGQTYPGDNYTDDFCGPDNGPNCPACRTIKSPRVEEILAGGRWQGMTGLVYCGRLFSIPGKIYEHHDGICGIDNGPACSDCNDRLNKKI